MLKKNSLIKNDYKIIIKLLYYNINFSFIIIGKNINIIINTNNSFFISKLYFYISNYFNYFLYSYTICRFYYLIYLLLLNISLLNNLLNRYIIKCNKKKGMFYLLFILVIKHYIKYD